MSVPSFDSLERGHIVLAGDPFKAGDDATRPWVVVNNETHPFDGQQYIGMALTTKTWYDARVPIRADEYQHRTAPQESSIVPHAIASLQPNLMTDYICRIQSAPIDRAVDTLLDYL